VSRPPGHLWSGSIIQREELVIRYPRRSLLGGVALAALLAIPIGPVSAQDTVPTGTLSIAFESGFITLDPAIAYDNVSWPAEWLLYDPLLGYGDGTDLQPRLAAAMPTISEDGLTYTFTLREGVPFVRRGEIVRTVTADDVVFSINRLLRPDLLPTPSPVGGAFFAGIAGAAEVLDGRRRWPPVSRRSTS